MSFSGTSGRNRGDRRALIFHDEAVRLRCVATLGEACAKTGWQFVAWVRRPNHFHLAVETPQPDLVAGMKGWPGTYPSRCNRRPKLSGTLFSRRYKSPIGDGSGSGYRKRICNYLPRNPARAQFTLG